MFKEPLLSESSLGLYIHWPFCLSKCPYCDFNSHVGKSVDENLFLAAYKRDLDTMRALTPASSLTSVFLGGGTPSLMSATLVGAILDYAAQLWHLPPQTEITLEANPTSVEIERLVAYKAAGITRVSIGIQSLRDHELAFLGRTHTAWQALQALDQARRIFDSRVSADFIYALPHQERAAWQGQLAQILALGLDHLSLYQLTIEEGTRFSRDWAKGLLVMPSSDLAADFYLLTHEQTAQAGLVSYEISNYARNKDHFCRHNLTYWLYHSYIGVGPGACGRVATANHELLATQMVRSPQKWLTHAPLEVCETLTPSMMSQEKLLMGLRTLYGVDTTGLNWANLVEDGFLLVRGNRLVATTKGRLVLNRLISVLCDTAAPDAPASPVQPKRVLQPDAPPTVQC